MPCRSDRTSRLAALGIVAALATLTGCAAPKYRMAYEIPTVPQASDGITIALGPVVDAREARGEIERFLEAPPADELANLLVRELLATGRVTRVLRHPDGGSAVLAIDAELRDLRWELPSYNTIKTTATVLGAVSGGLGAAVYGMTPTDVYGHSRLFVRVRTLKTGQTLLEREYVGKVSRRMSKIASDSGSTRVEMVSLAVQSLMTNVRTDLAPLLGSAIETTK